ncbi:serine/threonine protein kinase [Frankia torreyi]|uniref:Serine/threonine protein kinase n=2 Tax=Frankia TaxID=1854 RepID=A0A0D8BKL5_9ACTN|nr:MULTISPECIES: protein kinase [Frankia]KJE23937.1 serine/threonine protein kinase [Frankia torreyi]KQC38781.1 serine/threonine protein kinase [Frankia sp. ACN1ag]
MASSDADVAARAVPLGPDDPRELGSYTLLGKLGQGGMGMVYLGRSEKGRLVAIKVIRTEAVGNPEFRARFRLEAETARRVARVCTAEVLDADPDAEWPYLVTEFIEGETLARYVQRNGPLADANLEQLAVGVAAALTAIHSAGIVHRDLKPANVILSPFGPRVIDFGIARAVDAGSGLTGDLQQLGTPAFMSPEQIESQPITSAVDIWAWGGLVAFAATGHYPFGDASAQVLLYRALHEEPRLDDVDPALRPIVWLAMRKDPTTRPSAQQLMLRLLGDPAGTGPDAAAAVDPQDVTNVLQGWNLPAPGATGPGTGNPTAGAVGTGPAADVGGRGVAAAAARAGTAGAGAGAAGYTADPDAPTRLPTGLGAPAQPRPAGDGTVAGQSPTRVGAEPGGPSWPGGPGGSGGIGGSGGPGAPPGAGARSRGNRVPLLVGGGVVVVGAILAGILALSSGGDDKANDSGAQVKPATGTTAPAQPAAFTLPRSAEPLSRDTLVYASNRNGNYDLFRGDVTGDGGLQNDKPLLTGPDNDMLPAISGDRKTVVFFKKGSPNTLQAIAADGTGKPVQLFTSGPAAKLTIANDARPSLSPDSNFLVVRSSTDGTGAPNLGLYVVKLDGSSVQRLNAKPQATDPAWSPDSERIAYWSNKTGGDRGFIVVIPVQPNAEATPVINDTLTTDSDPVWSPDSDKIAFTRRQNGDLEIFEMNSDGSDVRQLTHARGDDQDPAFGPDGRIVFSGQRDPTNPNARQLFILNPNDPTAGDRQLTTLGGFNGHARWNAG